ncbi:M24 family metallopeptidase [Aureibaculum sp. 2210JD6-5]|uniref:M24 family metallopeptidase n=1 Tax=Aureibaculum sp. 2210JD6-5 TaxID=3103957 RepID=UPI002AAD214B|nr:M24 family metallopeptidase [Aureibaculum sp. 2210JD6-5]MDY7394777.1 M24 family metallopeptidase [Aureibaculum sp. 2210JD6-5]
MSNIKIVLLIISLNLSFHYTSDAQILPLRERADVIDNILKDRFDNLLPNLMDRTGIDMWILISREYNEDPVMRTMLPSTWLNARRRTVLVFYRNKEKSTIEKLAVARYNVGENIKSAWNKEEQPDQWKALFQLIEERNPTKIGLNMSSHFAIADGLVKSDYDWFTTALPETYNKKIVSAEKLAIAWIETRTEKEMEVFEFLSKLTHDVIAEAFSTKVITPGKTTTDDVVWFLRQKVNDLGLKTWFHPTVDIQRNNEKLGSHITSFSKRPPENIIQKSDLLHCDFGITYLRLNTDCQQHAYVLNDRETEVPIFLVEAFKEGNQLQDIFTNNFVAGKTGNEILLKSLKEAKEMGLKPSIYTHPLGTYGHSAGPTIGMWDAQEGVPVRGDYPLYKNTAYAIELNTTVHIKEWDRDIRIMLEEPGFFGKGGFRYIDNRQENIHVINAN